jgi:hypothetical protein
MRWAMTEAGKRMPLDPDPVPDGNIIPVPNPAGGDPLAHSLHKGETPPEGTPRFTSHYATCPQADQHRKRTP